MAELKCNAETCTYNKEHYCCKGDIMVGGKHADTTEGTCCESFVPVKGDSYTNTTKHPSATISIDCEAVKCVYNNNYKALLPFLFHESCNQSFRNGYRWLQGYRFS